MRTLWNTSRRCLSGGSLFPQRACLPYRLPRPSSACLQPCTPRRALLTLAIETSCDDTCVAILEKRDSSFIRLHFNEKITSDNRTFRGVHPLAAVVSHTENLAPLIQKALRSLPSPADVRPSQDVNSHGQAIFVDGRPRLRPDFISVTRGPGMASNLATGLNHAKGLAVAWDVPLVAVNHMQAHALTPRLVSALEVQKLACKSKDEEDASSQKSISPQFPFLSLLVSGGHTMLVHSKSLNDHAILAESMNIAVGDMIDKCARLIVPSETLSAEGSDSGAYGPIFEEFAFPGSRESVSYDYNYTPPATRAAEIKTFDSGRGWSLTPPLHLKGMGEEAASQFEFAGLGGQAQKLMIIYPDMDIESRRVLARATMTLVFEHLTTRLVYALLANNDQSRKRTRGQDRIRTVVLSGGVASNKFLRHVVRKMLDARGLADIEVIAPPVSLCTDNAAMIAWTGMEMYENGWRSDLDILTLRKWPLDPTAEGGGILGASGWYQVSVPKK
ncbi:glycoprotease family-domain-containing protein [Xylaria bambusicola]|uniref:glycoprotease family-domain-containing protein n=1 Tax=Xylaria bambusicola TaxID=326684 RepID=UPI0020088A98|nr:glycoprotease family-domain-containing protein [Xylaria bambusicola]KAI0525998.1 glycoprotease family-domain-containing protein [Xylaria bambusicola]